MLQQILLSLSYILTFFFFIYGYNCYNLLFAARKYKSPDNPESCSLRPPVVIQLPIYNEKYVVRRLVEACTGIAEDYGKSLVRIVVIDDSDDETSNSVDELVKEYSAWGFKIEVLRREEKMGFKAGALQSALNLTDEEYIAIFDADFIPPQDFLTRIIPHFLKDDSLGIVQTRWGHLNRDYNFLTRSVSIGIDAHFLIEQPGRYAADYFLNFNGSGGVIRKKALLEAGGWQSDTLAEDLDASYRIQIAGYKVLYLRELQSPGEVPPSVPSYKKQQGRWANGSLRAAKKLLPQLLFDKQIRGGKKLQASIHLTYYLVHPLMFASAALAIIATVFDLSIIMLKIPVPANMPQDIQGIIDSSFTMISNNLLFMLFALAILVCALAPIIFCTVSIKQQGLSIKDNIPSLILLIFIGYGISLSNTIESLKALLTDESWEFKRTPKYAIKEKGDDWQRKKYQVPLDITAALEAIAAIAGIIAIYFAVMYSNFGVIPILALYTISYALVSSLTLMQSRVEV